jgi:hypothetical protein
MSPRTWYVAGWVFMLATAGLAVAGATLTLLGLRYTGVQPLQSLAGGPVQRLAGTPVQPAVPGAAPVPPATEFMLGIILTVCAGVAFFSGLAAFFWGALTDYRQRLDKILGSRT